MCFGSSTLGAGAKTRLHTPKAVTYHEQPHYCRFMIGHSLGRMESRIKKLVWYGMVDVCDGYLAAEASGFTPHCVQAMPDLVIGEKHAQSYRTRQVPCNRREACAVIPYQTGAIVCFADGVNGPAIVVFVLGKL